jgi:hypothetical protein
VVNSATVPGLATGAFCTDIACSECTSWDVAPDGVWWDEVRCIQSVETPSFGVSCSADQIPSSSSSSLPTAYLPVATMSPPLSPQEVADPAPMAPPLPTVHFEAFWRTAGSSSSSCAPADNEETPFYAGELASKASVCQVIYENVASAVTMCSLAGSPSGRVCGGNGCNSDCVSIPSNTNATWNDFVCVYLSSIRVRLTCDNHTTFVAPPTNVTSSPSEEQEQPPAPPPVSSGGGLNFTAYIDSKCQTALLPLQLKANISECQHIAVMGSSSASSFYMRVDCYANNIVHGFTCGTDSTCTSGCTVPLPPAPSGLCIPYSGYPLVKAIRIACPVVAAAPPPPGEAIASSAAARSSSVVGDPICIALLLLLSHLAIRRGAE